MDTGALVAIGTVVGTLVLCGVIAWFVFNNIKKQSWQGVVVAKKTDEVEGSEEGFASTVYILIIKTDDGQQKNVKVGKKIWEEFKEGDKIIKEAGKFNPTKA